VEDQNLDITREKSLEVLEAARNANPPASLTSYVSITLNLILLRPSLSLQPALIFLHTIYVVLFLFLIFALKGQNIIEQFCGE